MPTEPALAAQGLTDDVVEQVLTTGALTLIGRLADASNASFLADAELDGVRLQCVYKPVAGERPLWDFPDGTLGAREVAARLVSEAGGWRLVPPTVFRDGRFGPGMCQQWVEVDVEHPLVDVVTPDALNGEWIPVLEAEDLLGRTVFLAHANDARLRDLAVLDVVINNADRKGGHVLPEARSGAGEQAEAVQNGAGRLWACDHGVTFHRHSKLRTVLWGWAGEPLRERDETALRQLLRNLDGPLSARLHELLSAGEVASLHARAERLLSGGTMPVPDGSWPTVPWPAM